MQHMGAKGCLSKKKKKERVFPFGFLSFLPYGGKRGERNASRCEPLFLTETNLP